MKLATIPAKNSWQRSILNYNLIFYYASINAVVPLVYKAASDDARLRAWDYRNKAQ